MASQQLRLPPRAAASRACEYYGELSLSGELLPCAD